MLNERLDKTFVKKTNFAEAEVDDLIFWANQSYQFCFESVLVIREPEVKAYGKMDRSAVKKGSFKNGII